MFKRVLNYFLNGLLMIIPLMIIVYLIYVSFVEFDSFLREKILNDALDFPGVGIIFFVIFITGIGFLSTTFLFKPIFQWLMKNLERIPLLKTIYTAITDLLSAFVGKKKRFNQPVLVQMGRDSGLEKLGFVTDKDLNYLNETEGKIGVYFPFSYGIMGSFYIVDKSLVTPVDQSASELMKYIVSGGISETEKNRKEE